MRVHLLNRSVVILFILATVASWSIATPSAVRAQDDSATAGTTVSMSI